LFDLPGYIVARLTAAGMRSIEDLGHCTYADAARFFSYRRSTHRNERDYGRHVNAIALTG
jgi:copper oxidase (laccase) domain-containing protein